MSDDFDPDYDGLRICSVCGDRETLGDVCWSCREQAMIDESDPPHICGYDGHDFDSDGICLYCGVESDD